MTDADGNIAQHVEYIPYGEVFVEERNNSFSTNYLFNAKELDNETGLYYYGARYLGPTGAMWLSVDPMWEKYAGMSPYNYCMGNPVKMVDPTGREVEDVDDLIKTFERVNGKISTCGSETNLREDSYSSVNASSVGFTSCTYYTGNIPVGDKYRNAGYGGCTEATLCSILDMFKIDENTYRRNKLDIDRITEGQKGNVYLRYNKLGVSQQHGLECEVIKNPKCYSDNIKSMKQEGNVFAMAYTISYMENGLTQKFNHNVVVTGIDDDMVQFWDNDKGCYSRISLKSVKELYKFSKSSTNPWDPVPYDIPSLPERYIYNYNK